MSAYTNDALEDLALVVVSPEKSRISATRKHRPRSRHRNTLRGKESASSTQGGDRAAQDVNRQHEHETYKSIQTS